MVSSSLKAVLGDVGPRRIQRALVSVFDKRGLEDFGQSLHEKGVEIISTGGSLKCLRNAGIPAVEIAEYTKSPELFDGRVKTLHPKIHGGILYVRGHAGHEAEAEKFEIGAIDLLVVNLYPFSQTVAATPLEPFSCIENIDIGGPSLLRAAAKNFASVLTVTSPNQYADVRETMQQTSGCSTLQQRVDFARAAFSLTAAYDAAITFYLNSQAFSDSVMMKSKAEGCAAGKSPSTKPSHDEKGARDGHTQTTLSLVRAKPILYPNVYFPRLSLKYGCNPHQAPAVLCALLGGMGPAVGSTSSSAASFHNGKSEALRHSGEGPMPFEVLNGNPGYINLLDAAFAWQLVRDLKQATGATAAASYKHCSPAGAALGNRPLTETEVEVFDVSAEVLKSCGGLNELGGSACAYIRARNGDPMCSFGDFVGLSDDVDEKTAKVLKVEVSDGIVAPGYSPEALRILAAKKGGAFVVLQADVTYVPPELEFRDIYGMGFVQKRNTAILDQSKLQTIVTERKEVPENILHDMILASLCVKYTQSNSVGYALNGQMIGVGAGQQSRVDCVKLAGKKSLTWHLRHHPKVRSLKFKEGLKRQDRVNARVRYIEGDMTELELKEFMAKFTEAPVPLTEGEKKDYTKTLKGITISSDAFFPFRDSIDHCSKFGVEFVVHPGGSAHDGEVTEAANQYNMAMAHSATRLFLH